MTCITPDVDDRDTRVLLAVMRLPRPTYAKIMAATGLRSQETLSLALRRLRAAGLVSFEDKRQGTIHPLVRAVAVRTP